MVQARLMLVQLMRTPMESSILEEWVAVACCSIPCSLPTLTRTPATVQMFEAGAGSLPRAAQPRDRALVQALQLADRQALATMLAMQGAAAVAAGRGGLVLRQPQMMVGPPAAQPARLALRAASHLCRRCLCCCLLTARAHYDWMHPPWQQRLRLSA